MPTGYVPVRFGGGTGTTTATFSVVVPVGHRYIVLGGNAGIVATAAGTITVTIVTGAVTRTYRIVQPSGGGPTNFIVGGGGAGAMDTSGGGDEGYVMAIGKNFIANAGETLSITISGGVSGANVALDGVDYTI